MKILSLLVAFAACGGGSSKPAPVTPEPTPVAVEPTPQPPAEPVAVVEPAPEPTPAAPEPAKVKADLLAVEMAAYEKSKPVFEKFCASCHSKGQKNAKKKTLDHFDISTYPFGGHHAMELGVSVRKVLGLTGDKSTMPKGKPGAVKGDDLALVAAWADAFDASHKGGAHEGQQGHDHGHGHDAPKKDAPKAPGAHKH